MVVPDESWGLVAGHDVFDCLAGKETNQSLRGLLRFVVLVIKNSMSNDEILERVPGCTNYVYPCREGGIMSSGETNLCFGYLAERLELGPS